MVTTFELRTDRPDAAGRCAVRMVVCFDGHRLRLATPERCLPRQWDSDRQQFRRSFPGYQEANEALQADAERVHATYRRLRAEHGTVTPDLLRAGLAALTAPTAPVEPAAPDLVPLFDNYRVVLKARGFMAHTLKSYTTVRNHLAAFVDLMGGATVADYTMGMHDEFLGYLRDVVGLSQNTVAGSVKCLKPFLA